MQQPRFGHLITNPEQQRPKALWRILTQLIIMVLLLGLSEALVGGMLEGHLRILWNGAMITLSIYVAARLLDGRPLSDYGIRTGRLWWREFGLGFAAGAIAMLLLYLLYLGVGWAEWTGYGWQRSFTYGFSVALIGYFLVMCAVGFYEELWVRGYLTRNIAEGIHTGRFDEQKAGWTALAVTSVAFGLLHAGNPNATVLSTLIITMAGVMLCLPYLITGRLGLPIGLHISWNFFQGGVFGFPVSGMPNRSSLLQSRITGPDLLTGGSFGPEAGIAGLVAVLLLIAALFLYYRRAGYALKVHTGFTDPPSTEAQHMS